MLPFSFLMVITLYFVIDQFDKELHSLLFAMHFYVKNAQSHSYGISFFLLIFSKLKETFSSETELIVGLPM